MEFFRVQANCVVESKYKTLFNYFLNTLITKVRGKDHGCNRTKDYPPGAYVVMTNVL